MASSELQRLLARGEAKFGKDHPGVKMLRDQIATEGRGQSAQDLYLTGSVASLKAGPSAQPDQQAKGEQPS